MFAIDCQHTRLSKQKKTKTILDSFIPYLFTSLVAFSFAYYSCLIIDYPTQIFASSCYYILKSIYFCFPSEVEVEEE